MPDVDDVAGEQGLGPRAGRPDPLHIGLPWFPNWQGTLH